MRTHNKKATTQRPPHRRRADSRAGDSVAVTRAERLLRVREVASMLHVTPATVYNMIRRGELRAMYLRHMVRLDAREVRAYMRVHKARVLRQRARQPRRARARVPKIGSIE